MNAPPVPQTFPGRRWNIIAAAFLTLILAAFALRAELLAVRFFDPDELEHLQASFLVSRGLVPHRDFFEHHSHLFHYLLLPLLLPSPGAETIFSARVIMFGLSALILLAAGRSARVLGPPGAALLAAAWLSLDFVFLSKTLEVRPDVPATLFLLLGLLCLLGRGGQGAAGWAGAGLAFSLAFLSTQKAVFPILGLATGALFLRAKGGEGTRWTAWTKWINYGAAGGAFLVPLLAYHLYFLKLGVLSQLVRENYLLHLSWKHTFSPLLFLSPVALFDPLLIVWAGAGTFLAFREAGGDRRFLLPAGALIGGALGALISPVVYAQYYAMLIPFAVVLAATALIRFLSRLPSLSGRDRFLAGSLLSLPALLQGYLVFFSGYRYPIRLENAPLWAIVALGAGAAAWCIASRRPGRFSVPLVAVCLLAASVPRAFAVMIEYRSFGNGPFLRSLRKVHALSGPDDRVLDGWTGLGVFRLPAYYHGFLHPEILLILPAEGTGPGLLRALETNRPAAIIRDQSWYSFAPEVRGYIGENYATAGEEWLGGERITLLKSNRRRAEADLLP